MKTEPGVYSIDDLKKKGTDAWDGVRNYQARNFMMTMKVGDGVLFYHSGKEPGVVGLAKVAKLAYPDASQFDKKDMHFDPKATKEKPIWFCVDVQFVQKFKTPMMLAQIKREKKLAGMRVREVGSRLSVQPVSKEHFEHIAQMAQ
ncbi:MAG: EVE domain-containing protein [bacterium]